MLILWFGSILKAKDKEKEELNENMNILAKTKTCIY